MLHSLMIRVEMATAMARVIALLIDLSPLYGVDGQRILAQQLPLLLLLALVGWEESANSNSSGQSMS